MRLNETNPNAMTGSADIAHLRLASQYLVGSRLSSPTGLVAWMGAIQAQDFPMAKWGLGLRLPGSTEAQIEAALNQGEILRTHMLRPTWHFVSARDIYWMLELTAQQIKIAQGSRDRTLELTPEVYRKSNAIIEKALGETGQLTREELLRHLEQAGIDTRQNRSAHLLMQAELDQLICSGAIQNGRQTYALLSGRVPKKNVLTREEALATLARLYFTSRCPATLQDFAWWSGLNAGHTRQALELIKPEFSTREVDEKTYYFPRDFVEAGLNSNCIFLLPTYDELILSYRDRSASIPPELEAHMKEISDRGVFWPVILLDGQVVGTWKRTIRKSSLFVEAKLFGTPRHFGRNQLNAAAHQLGKFMGLPVETAIQGADLP